MRIYPIKIRNKWNEWHTSVLIFVFFLPFEPTENPKTFVQVKLGARTSYELTCTPSYVSAQSHFRSAKLQSMQTDAMPWSLLFSQTEQPNNLRHLFWRFFFAYFMAVVDFRYLLNDRFVYERNILLI